MRCLSGDAVRYVSFINHGSRAANITFLKPIKDSDIETSFSNIEFRNKQSPTRRSAQNNHTFYKIPYGHLELNSESNSCRCRYLSTISGLLTI